LKIQFFILGFVYRRASQVAINFYDIAVDNTAAFAELL